MYKLSEEGPSKTSDHFTLKILFVGYLSTFLTYKNEFYGYMMDALDLFFQAALSGIS